MPLPASLTGARPIRGTITEEWERQQARLLSDLGRLTYQISVVQKHLAAVQDERDAVQEQLAALATTVGLAEGLDAKAGGGEVKESAAKAPEPGEPSAAPPPSDTPVT